MLKSKINIHVLHTENNFQKNYLIFDNDASIFLKENRRMCSRKIGTLCQVGVHDQNSQTSLPMQIALEEVCLLADLYSEEINLIRTNYSNLESLEHSENFQKLKSSYNLYLENLNSKQIELFRVNRRNQILEKKDQILEGKRKKLISQLNKIESDMLKNDISKEQIDKLREQKTVLINNLENLELNFNQELENLKKYDIVFNEIEIFLQTPKFYENLFKLETISIDEFKIFNKNFMSCCKYLTFKFLYSKGYYLTSGAKFGGDFLVYPGDPVQFHSQYILVCLDNLNDYNSLTLKQLVTYARMATTVKKTFLISLLTNEKIENRYFSFWLNDGNFRLNFLSLKWAHI